MLIPKKNHSKFNFCNIAFAYIISKHKYDSAVSWIFAVFFSTVDENVSVIPVNGKMNLI